MAYIKQFSLATDTMSQTISSKGISVAQYNQGDVNTDQLSLTITHNNSVMDLTGATVSVVFSKPDGTIVYQDTTNGVTVTNATQGQLSISLNTQTRAAVGTVVGAVRVTYPNNQILETEKFSFNVEQSLASDQAIASVNDVSGLIGTETLTTNAQDIKGAINEVNAELASNTSQLADIVQVNIKQLKQSTDTDYTNAFQSLASNYPNGVKVFIPAGTYMTDGFNLPSNVVLYGIKGQSIIKLKNNATQHLVNATGQSILNIITLELDGNAANQTQNLQCINFKDCDNVFINLCKIHDAKGVYIVELFSTQNNKHVWVERNEIFNTSQTANGSYLFVGGTDYYPFSKYKDVNIVNNTIYCVGTDASSSAIEVDGLQDYSIIGNECYNMGRYGIQCDTLNDGLAIIERNKCHDNKYSGIGFNGSIVTAIPFNVGTTAFTPYTTVTQAGGATATVLGYTLTSGSFAQGNAVGYLSVYNVSGTLTTSGSLSVGGVVYASTNGANTSYSGNSNPLVKNNECYNNGWNGIENNSQPYARLKENICKNNGYRGIYIGTTNAKGTVASDNNCFDNGSALTGTNASGIFVGATDGVKLSNNIGPTSSIQLQGISVVQGATNASLNFNHCDNYYLYPGTCRKIDGVYVDTVAPSSLTGVPLYRGMLYYQFSQYTLWRYEESSFAPVIKPTTSISSAPLYVGQTAVVNGLGYMATGTSATTDWKQVTN